MKPNYISIVTISALFYQLLIAPLSAMTNPASPHMDDHASVAVASVSIPIVDDEQVSLPVPTPQKQLGALIEDLRMFQGNGKAELEQHGLWPLCQEIKNLRSLSKDAIAVLKAEKDKLSQDNQKRIRAYIHIEQKKIKEILTLQKEIKDIQARIDAYDDAYLKYTFCFFGVAGGFFCLIFYLAWTGLSAFEEMVSGSVSYSPFAFFAQEYLKSQLNSSTTLTYLKEMFQNNTQMQNTLVEAAHYSIREEAFSPNISDSLSQYVALFRGAFKYFDSSNGLVMFSLCFNMLNNVTSTFNVKTSDYSWDNWGLPVCDNTEEEASALFTILNPRKRQSYEWPYSKETYKFAAFKPKISDWLMDNQKEVAYRKGVARREFVAQSAEDVADLIESNPDLPKLIFNMTKQMRSHICPAEIMMTRLQDDALKVLSTVIAPSNHTFFYFWFNRHGGLVRTNYSTDGTLGNISFPGCDWESHVDFGNDAHVRMAFNANGRMWMTDQQLDFLPGTATVEKTHTRKLSASQELTDTATWRQSASKELVDTESGLNSDTATGGQSASEELVDTNTTEQSASKELIETNTTEQSPSDSSERSLSETTDRNTWTSSKSLTALRWLANLTGLENSSQAQYSWTEMIPNGAAGSPPARYGHAAGRMGDEMFIGFGVSASGSYLSDTWALNLTSLIWRNLGASIPARRYPGTFTYNDSTWVFQGYGSTDSILTRFSKEGYQAFPTSGYATSGVGLPAMTTIGDKFYIFGGSPLTGGASYLNTIYQIQNTSSIWQDITPATSPSRRSGCQFAVINQDAYIFGGVLLSDATTNDVWKFNSASSGWTQIFPTAGASGFPSNRYTYTMGALGTDIFIFGGDGITNDLWRLDTQIMRWNLITANGQAGSPPGRGFGALDFVKFNSDLYVFGGKYIADSASHNCYNDLWRLREKKVRLYNVTVFPNPIIANQNFTLSWIADVLGGATGHLANITFNGHTYVQTFDGTLGSIILMANSTLGNNFSIPLSVQDRLSAFDYNAPYKIEQLSEERFIPK